MFPKADGAPDAWDQYSDRLRDRALNIVDVRGGGGGTVSGSGEFRSNPVMR